MYDRFSSDYDRFVNWPGRLAYEMPLIEQLLEPLGKEGAKARVLDAACGTGMHVLALARSGYPAAGADLSEGMIERARENARSAGVDATFAAAGFGQLARAFQNNPLYPFDALLCLGNSLPHLLSKQALAETLADFAACLSPGGMVMIQNRNFDAVMEARERWMEPQSHREGEHEWVFLRFYDYLSGEETLIDFNIITLRRDGPGEPWQQSLTTTRLRPLGNEELSEALAAAGFRDLRRYGSMKGEAFDPISSGNLILTARR